jgi:hypothetical protein
MESEYLLIAAAALTGLCVVAATMLKGWQGWLALKARELDKHQQHPEIGSGPSGGAYGIGARIEISDLKERIRKLEAIAAGVDL